MHCVLLFVLLEASVDWVTRVASYQATASAVVLTPGGASPTAYEATSSAVLIALGGDLLAAAGAATGALSRGELTCLLFYHATSSAVPIALGGLSRRRGQDPMRACQQQDWQLLRRRRVLAPPTLRRLVMRGHRYFLLPSVLTPPLRVVLPERLADVLLGPWLNWRQGLQLADWRRGGRKVPYPTADGTKTARGSEQEYSRPEGRRSGEVQEDRGLGHGVPRSHLPRPASLSARRDGTIGQRQE